MTVWIARASSDNDALGFKNLDLTSTSSLNDNPWKIVEAVEKDAKSGIKSQNRWEPQQGYWGRRHPGNPGHFVYMTGNLACNAEAWHLLEDRIKSNVEGLPIVVEGFGTFYLLNVFTVIDCLDRERLREALRQWRAKELDGVRPAFHEDLLEGVMMFRPANDPDQVYATDAFKSLVERYKFTHIEFLSP